MDGSSAFACGGALARSLPLQVLRGRGVAAPIHDVYICHQRIENLQVFDFRQRALITLDEWK
jgi:hypothetical protein